MTMMAAQGDSFEVVQVSDTHLGTSPALLVEGFRRVAAHVAALSPRLVVNTGDVSYDGVLGDADLELARQLHADLGVPVRVLPGNHDVGEIPGAVPPELEPVVTDTACERFARIFGDDKFLVDHGDYRLLGINAQVLGSGLPAEAVQWRHVEHAAATRDGRRLALFVHKPLFVEELASALDTPHCLPVEASRRLLELLGSDLCLVASGHLHRHRVREVDGVLHAWAPSTGFVSGGLPLPGEPVVGFLRHRFGPEGVRTEVVCPDDMVSHQFLENPELYPAYQAKARQPS